MTSDLLQDKSLVQVSMPDRVHVPDLHATILHLMGMDHTKLTYFYQGMNQRITGVRGVVVKKAIV